ncbi:MAG: sulfur carrier protein ThiS [Planctomycetota bacterium]|nr:MAG: sulfur carrier protein ThiS [Planctomycetota bacterium]
MRIIVNGEEIETADGLTLDALLRERGRASAPCATEVNRQLVPRDDRPGVVLADGDRVEIVTLVGGG